MMKYSTMKLAALAFLLLAGPALSRPESINPEPQEDFDLDQIEDNAVYTPHNSILNIQEVDEALIGTWRLDEMFMILPTMQRAFPTKGRTLSISANGQYTEDYSTAQFTDQAAGASAVLPMGLQSCAQTAVFTGTAQGEMRVEAYFDLDVELEGGGHPVGFTLYLKRIMGEKPKITCPGANTDVVTTAVSPPLGTGRVQMTSNGPRLPYSYTISQDWKTLVMTTQTQPQLRYTFSRLGF
jgi:hypothetical protein